MDYVPNLDAAEQLVTSILPALRQQASTADLHLVGSGDGATSLARYPGVTVHGFVDDLAPLYARADVAVIPLRAGGGSRVKILEAFAHGLPVVATSTAALGLDVENGDQLLIADTQADLVTAALHVVTDAKLAKHLVISAQRFVNENHDVDVIAGRISDQIQSWM
jgi:glycosyltransferase involved in cell wall biosynthesis